MVLLREFEEVKAMPEFVCAAMPGQVVVECVSNPESQGGILLPDELREVMRPDIGVVLASGEGVHLRRGDHVAFNPHHGVWVEGMSFPGYAPSGQVRVFGKADGLDGEMFPVSWWVSVLMVVEKGNFRATGYNVVIDRDPVVESQGGIMLPDSSKFRDCWATVVSVGEFVDGRFDGGYLSPGDRVHYSPSGVKLRGGEVQDLMAVDARGKNLAIIHELAINAVVRA